MVSSTDTMIIIMIIGIIITVIPTTLTMATDSVIKSNNNYTISTGSTIITRSTHKIITSNDNSIINNIRRSTLITSISSLIIDISHLRFEDLYKIY